MQHAQHCHNVRPALHTIAASCWTPVAPQPERYATTPHSEELGLRKATPGFAAACCWQHRPPQVGPHVQAATSCKIWTCDRSRPTSLQARSSDGNTMHSAAPTRLSPPAGDVVLPCTTPGAPGTHQAPPLSQNKTYSLALLAAASKLLNSSALGAGHGLEPTAPLS
jgi:hypothetical protein